VPWYGTVPRDFASPPVRKDSLIVALPSVRALLRSVLILTGVISPSSCSSTSSCGGKLPHLRDRQGTRARARAHCLPKLWGGRTTQNAHRTQTERTLTGLPSLLSLRGVSNSAERERRAPLGAAFGLWYSGVGYSRRTTLPTSCRLAQQRAGGCVRGEASKRLPSRHSAAMSLTLASPCTAADPTPRSTAAARTLSAPASCAPAAVPSERAARTAKSRRQFAPESGAPASARTCRRPR
jgi:hypothetical protein